MYHWLRGIYLGPLRMLVMVYIYIYIYIYICVYVWMLVEIGSTARIVLKIDLRHVLITHVHKSKSRFTLQHQAATMLAFRDTTTCEVKV